MTPGVRDEGTGDEEEMEGKRGMSEEGRGSGRWKRAAGRENE